MPVIAMTREMGSRGRDVAAALATSLELTLVQHELVERIEDKMQVRRDSVNRFLEGKAGFLERWGISESDLSLYTTEEILDVAMRGDVLLRGWGATAVLQPITHVLRLRVCAPIENRVQTMVGRLEMRDPQLARKEIERSDAAHARVMLDLFDVEWTDPVHYDVVLNTARVSIEECVELVEAACALPQFTATEESEQQLKRLLLVARVRAALYEDTNTRQAPASFEFSVAPNGEVTLLGLVTNHAFSVAAETVIGRVPGVTGVFNEMVDLPSGFGGLV